MATPKDAQTAEEREKGPPCRRCGHTSWQVERRPKGLARWLAELAVAAPDVLLFGGESGGWPARQAQLWTCQGCRRRVRL